MTTATFPQSEGPTVPPVRNLTGQAIHSPGTCFYDPDAFPIDEATRRRPSFRADYGATLADGQVWFFRRPRAWLGLRRYPDGTRRMGQMFDFGEGQFRAEAAYRARVDALEAADAEPFDAPGVLERRIVAQLDLIGSLLRRNYDLSEAEADAVVAFDFSGESGPAAIAEREGLLILAQGLLPATPPSHPSDVVDAVATTGGPAR